MRAKLHVTLPRREDRPLRAPIASHASLALPTAAALMMALMGCGKAEEVTADPITVDRTVKPAVTADPGSIKVGGGVPEEVANPYIGPIATPPPPPAKVITPVKRPPPLIPHPNPYPMKGGLGVVHPSAPLGTGARPV